MLLLVALAAADTFWDVTPDQAQAIVAALRPGDLLLRWCPGCGPEAVVVEVKKVWVTPGTYSDGAAVGLRWKAKAEGRAGEGGVFADGLSCGAPTTCLADPAATCAGKDGWVDIPYTWRRDAAGGWTWVGDLAGLENGPGPLVVAPAVDAAVLACKAKPPKAG